MVSVLDFGAFVEIREGLDGLVHVSEIGYANPEDPKAVLKKVTLSWSKSWELKQRGSAYLSACAGFRSLSRWNGS